MVRQIFVRQISNYSTFLKAASFLILAPVAKESWAWNSLKPQDTTPDFQQAQRQLKEQIASTFSWADHSTLTAYNIRVCGHNHNNFKSCFNFNYDFSVILNPDLSKYRVWLTSALIHSSDYYNSLFTNKQSLRAITTNDIKVRIGQKFLDDLANKSNEELAEIYPIYYSEKVYYQATQGNILTFESKLQMGDVKTGVYTPYNRSYINIDVRTQQVVKLLDIFDPSPEARKRLLRLIKLNTCTQVIDSIALSAYGCSNIKDTSSVMFMNGFYFKNNALWIKVFYNLDGNNKKFSDVKLDYSIIQDILDPYCKENLLITGPAIVKRHKPSDKLDFTQQSINSSQEKQTSQDNEDNSSNDHNHHEQLAND